MSGSALLMNAEELLRETLERQKQLILEKQRRLVQADLAIASSANSILGQNNLEPTKRISSWGFELF